MPRVASGSHRMYTLLVLQVALLGVLPRTATAYDTGAMSCDDIGQFAASVVEGKEKGRTQREQLASIAKIVPSLYGVERRILTTVVHQLYTAPYAKHLTSDGAFASYKAECEAQQ